MYNNFKRLVSVIMLIPLIFTILPTKAIAETLNNNLNIYEQSVQHRNDNYEKILNTKIIKEIKEKREKNIKYFLKDDLSYEAAIYPFAIHYKENGKWKDIDNTLIESNDKNDNSIVENKENNYKIKISKNVNSDKLVNIKKDKYEIAWNIQDSIINKTIQNQQAVEGMLQDDIYNTKQLHNSALSIKKPNTKILEKLTADEKKRTLTKVLSEAFFLNIYENVDLQYEIRPESVKETIVINNKINDPKFYFNIQTKNLTYLAEVSHLL
ncbi:hypothetical protein CLTEP_25650 [Clostridium tepidiprofundi DSM 19306]|uniref:Uncharacterized protein n=1 Tax=Clostridium tepidiprofundi DSM 19306 TaxID=1121338 RepID=A0A151AT85_9CLOT|nr:hypothetical protein [Clostridium tepidiprofundi]KYH30597.1 hypothetical protein CLTEP_25650 [Clostridium tepidiprofundi DSM 19306]